MTKPKLIGLYSPTPGCGKSTIAQLAEEYGWVTVSFAWPLKAMLRGLFESVEMGHRFEYYSTEGKEEPIPEFYGKTFRFMARTLGTEWGRNLIHRDFWIQTFRLRVIPFLDQGVVFICDDTRFENEALTIIKEFGGEIWKIERSCAAHLGSSHVSDGGLEHWPEEKFDRIIINEGSKEDLKRLIDTYLPRA